MSAQAEATRLAAEDVENQRLAVGGCRREVVRAMDKYESAFTTAECKAADLSLGRATGDLSAALAKFGAACDRLAFHRREAARGAGQ